MNRLRQWFRQHPAVALAFSGGCDSTLLLHAALDTGIDCRAYLVSSQFLSQHERDDALRLAKGLGAHVRVIDCDILAIPDVRHNPPDRCYHCKKSLFQLLAATARCDGYTCVIDGSNASDAPAERPGMRALGGLGVLSPLRECGLDKTAIRALSREAGLETWNKPANACLATRIPTGEDITQEDLRRVEDAEDRLRQLGFSDFRVRLWHNAARIQLPEAQMTIACAMRQTLCEQLRGSFDAVLLDMEGR